MNSSLLDISTSVIFIQTNNLVVSMELKCMRYYTMLLLGCYNNENVPIELK